MVIGDVAEALDLVIFIYLISLTHIVLMVYRAIILPTDPKI